MAFIEVKQLGTQVWYRRGRYWYKKSTGSASAYELKTCVNLQCGKEFFGARQLNRLGNPARFCSIRCSRQGSLNPQWVGDRVSYRAAHLRVARARGKASSCGIPGCVTAEGHSAAFHWANLTGNLIDVDDYLSMCVFHHRAFDWAKILGMPVGEALARVGRIPAEIQRRSSSERC